MEEYITPTNADAFLKDGLTTCPKHGDGWLVYDTATGFPMGDAAVADCYRCQFERENYDEEGLELGGVVDRMISEERWDAVAWAMGYDSWDQMREAEIEKQELEREYQRSVGWLA